MSSINISAEPKAHDNNLEYLDRYSLASVHKKVVESGSVLHRPIYLRDR